MKTSCLSTKSLLSLSLEDFPGKEICLLMILALVVQRLDNAIHRINRYPADKC